MNDEAKTAEQQFEASLESLAVHEISHWHVAISFGIPARVEMEITDSGWIRGGFCEREFAGKNFEVACIGWAGIVGEHLLNRVDTQRTPLLFPLTETTIVKWHWEALFYLNELSDGDRRCIVAHAGTLETCQYTFRILTQRIREIEADAKLLAEKTRREIKVKQTSALELKTLAERLKIETQPVLINGVPKIPVSIAGRARILADYLQGRPDDDPETIRLAPMLASLRRGEVPIMLNGELRQP